MSVALCNAGGAECFPLRFLYLVPQNGKINIHKLKYRNMYLFGKRSVAKRILLCYNMYVFYLCVIKGNGIFTYGRILP